MPIKSDPSKDEERKRRKIVQQISTAAAAAAECDSVQVALSLPVEIITHILARLPVKYLLQFRCVCKSWRTLVSDPIFAKIHLKASAQDENYAQRRLLMSSSCSRFDVKSCSLSSVLNHESILCTQALKYPLMDPKPSVRIVGSVNGLVCIVIDDIHVFLWNPSTRKSRRLPNCGIRKRPNRYVYGFGYDEASSDYKVVVTYCLKPHYPDPAVRIHGLKSKSWRISGNFPRGSTPSYSSGMFVSGSLHWSASSVESRLKKIISFDLSKETFSEFSQPCYEELDTVLFSMVGVLSGSLCLLCNISGIQSDVWVMKEYGNAESWSKVFSVSYMYQDKPHFDFRYSAPLFISKKNEVIVLLGSQLVAYNIDTNTIWYPDVDKCFEIGTYIESLVSLSPE